MSSAAVATGPVDRAGALASGLCAVHCAVCGLLPAAVGVLGLGILLHPAAEWALTGIAVAFALTAMFLGFRRHRSVWLAGVFLIGIVGLLTTRWMESGAHSHGQPSVEVHRALSSPSDPMGETANATGDTGHKERKQQRHHEDEGGLGEILSLTFGATLFSAHLLSLRRSRRHPARDRACPRKEA